MFENIEQTFGIKLQKLPLFMVWRFLGMINRKPEDLKVKSEFDSISDTESELSSKPESDSPPISSKQGRKASDNNDDKT